MRIQGGDEYFWGSMIVLQVFFFSLLLMIVFGLIGAAAKLSDNRVAQEIAGAYPVISRGATEILVILLIYFGSAITLTQIAQIFNPDVKFVDVPPVWAGTIAIGLIICSYATETFRGAFLGVKPGSIEAARALGMTNLQTFIYIRIPEMWRLAMPHFGNHMPSLIKDTALISIIGLNETFFVAKQAIGTTGEPFTMYIVVCCIYLAFSTIITLSVMGIEKLGARPGEGAR